jgi:IS30 family transposase
MDLSTKIIAEMLGRNKSTITREIKRGNVTKKNWNTYMSKNPQYPSFIESNVYYWDVGQRKYEENRKECRYKGKQCLCQDLIEYVKGNVLSEAKISIDEAIGYARVNNLFPGQNISTKTFYNWIDKGINGISNFDLLCKIGRKPRKKCKNKEHKRVFGKSIEVRPISVENREEFGHWEGDLIVGKKKTKSCIFTLVERKVRIYFSFKIPNKESKNVIEVINRLKKEFGIYFSNIFKSITFDNGSEFSDSVGIESGCETKVYYA